MNVHRPRLDLLSGGTYYSDGLRGKNELEFFELVLVQNHPLKTSAKIRPGGSTITTGFGCSTLTVIKSLYAKSSEL